MKLTGTKVAEAKPANRERKLCAVLADCGYFTIRRTDDYKGADLIAQREGEEPMMIQLKPAPVLTGNTRGICGWPSLSARRISRWGAWVTGA